MALAALFTSACAGAPAEPRRTLPAPTPTSPVASSCAVARPDFGGAATAADRALFAYDVRAPLNLQKAVESTNNGVEVSAVSFGSPDGGSVTGLLFDPVGRSGLRPGIVLMHGMPGNARSMAGHAQQLARSGAVVIAIDAPFARRGGPPVRYSAEDRAEQVQLIKDLQRAVDVLRTRATSTASASPTSASATAARWVRCSSASNGASEPPRSWWATAASSRTSPGRRTSPSWPVCPARRVATGSRPWRP
jgi:hypothetical protein